MPDEGDVIIGTAKGLMIENDKALELMAQRLVLDRIGCAPIFCGKSIYPQSQRMPIQILDERGEISKRYQNCWLERWDSGTIAGDHIIITGVKICCECCIETA
jgi:hypothetical protein